MPGSTPVLTPSPDFAPRAEEAQAILSRSPPLILQWSNTIFLGILLLLLGIAWLVRYPDTVQAPLRLTMAHAPKAVTSHTAGKLTRLLVHENQVVRPGEIVGYLESTARPTEVLALATDLEQLRQQVTVGRVGSLAAFTGQRYRQLGELQPAYQTFQQGLMQYESFRANGFYPRKRQLIQQEISDLQQLAQIMKTQTDLNKQDLRLAEASFQVQQQLYAQKVIPTLEFRQEESKLLAKKMPVQQAEAALISNLSIQSTKQRELLELDKSSAEQKDLLLQALATCTSALDDWKRKYLLASPVGGTIHFTSFLEENQEVVLEQELFFVAQQPFSEYGEVQIPQQNSGKVKLGQRAWLEFRGYPAAEYGLVEGRVAFISEIPNKEGAFTAKMLLPNGLISNYQRKLTYKTGMTGTADIITDDTRLLSRIFNNLRQVIARH